MRTIRQGVFETNSSSTHSICIVTKTEFERWKNGELVLDVFRDKLVTKEEAMEEINKREGFEAINDENFLEFINEDENQTYKSYEGFMDNLYSGYRTYETEYAPKSDEPIIIFGEYGYDG